MSEDERIAAVVERVARAQEEMAAAMKARDELLVELSPGGVVPIELARRFGLGGREATSIVRRASGEKPWLPPGARS